MEHETGDLIELEELDELVEEQERDNDEDEEFEHVEHESDLVLPDDEFDRDEECLERLLELDERLDVELNEHEE